MNNSPGSPPEQINNAINHNHWIRFDTEVFPYLVVPCIVREKDGRFINYLPARIIQSVILNLFENLPDEIIDLVAFRLIKCEPSELKWLNDINNQRSQIFGSEPFERNEFLIHSDAFLGFYDRLKKQYTLKPHYVSSYSTVSISQPAVASHLLPKEKKKDDISPLVVCPQVFLNTQKSSKPVQVSTLFYKLILFFQK
jgi:hypothetical protein